MYTNTTMHTTVKGRSVAYNRLTSFLMSWRTDLSFKYWLHAGCTHTQSVLISLPYRYGTLLKLSHN